MTNTINHKNYWDSYQAPTINDSQARPGQTVKKVGAAALGILAAASTAVAVKMTLAVIEAGVSIISAGTIPIAIAAIAAVGLAIGSAMLLRNTKTEETNGVPEEFYTEKEFYNSKPQAFGMPTIDQSLTASNNPSPSVPNLDGIKKRVALRGGASAWNKNGTANPILKTNQPDSSTLTNSHSTRGSRRDSSDSDTRSLSSSTPSRSQSPASPTLSDSRNGHLNKADITARDRAIAARDACESRQKAAAADPTRSERSVEALHGIQHMRLGHRNEVLSAKGNLRPIK